MAILMLLSPLLLITTPVTVFNFLSCIFVFQSPHFLLSQESRGVNHYLPGYGALPGTAYGLAVAGRRDELSRIIVLILAISRLTLIKALEFSSFSVTACERKSNKCLCSSSSLSISSSGPISRYCCAFISNIPYKSHLLQNGNPTLNVFV
jgi:hypothetical protein